MQDRRDRANFERLPLDSSYFLVIRNSARNFHDLQLAVGRACPPQYPLRLGDGRRDVFHRADHRGHGRRTRRLHRAAATGVRLEHRGDFLGAVGPLHPVRADGAVRGGAVESLRPAQRDAVRPAGGDLRAGGIARHDKGLAIDAAVGRRDRHRHRHDGIGARRHHCRALVRRAAGAGGRHSRRQRGDRATDFPAAARQPHRADGLADRGGPDLRDARRRRFRRADADARPSGRCRAAAVWRSGPGAAAGASGQPYADHGAALARWAMPPGLGCSGSCSAPSSSAAPRPTAWSRFI